MGKSDHLTDEERVLLKTARDLALRFASPTRAPVPPVGSAAESPRRAFGIAEQTKVLSLAAELAQLRGHVVPLLEVIVKAEKAVSRWLRGHSDFLAEGGSFRVLPTLLSDLAGKESVFFAPKVATFFELLWSVREQGELDAFRDVVAVLCPEQKGKRKPFISRSRDTAELNDFLRIHSALRAAHRAVPSGIRSASRIHEHLATKVILNRAEICDAVARFRRHTNRLTLLQLASLVWKVAERPRTFRYAVYYQSPPPHESTGVATASRSDARTAEYEVQALRSRVREAKKHEELRRKPLGSR